LELKVLARSVVKDQELLRSFYFHLLISKKKNVIFKVLANPVSLRSGAAALFLFLSPSLGFRV
jgi:hypothetical protein